MNIKEIISLDGMMNIRNNVCYLSSKKLHKCTLDYINNFVDSVKDITEEQRIVRKLQMIKCYENELNLEHKSKLSFWKRIFSK